MISQSYFNDSVKLKRIAVKEVKNRIPKRLFNNFQNFGLKIWEKPKKSREISKNLWSQKTSSSKDPIHFRRVQPALILWKMNRPVGHPGDRMQTLLMSKYMKENDLPCLFRQTKPCSLSTEEWTTPHSAGFSGGNDWERNSICSARQGTMWRRWRHAWRERLTGNRSSVDVLNENIQNTPRVTLKLT